MVGKLEAPAALSPGGAPSRIELDSGRAQVLVRTFRWWDLSHSPTGNTNTLFSCL